MKTLGGAEVKLRMVLSCALDGR